MSGGATAAAAAAAAARARAMREEEESMTGYTPEELAAGWEFKILRTATSRFKDGQFLRQTLEEEARAGWTLVEKFDDKRIRLKRPASARAKDASLGFDPYRVWVGISENQLGLIIAACVMGAMLVLVLIIVIATRK